MVQCGCGGRCGSDVGEKENIFFAAMEFSKPSKPRVWYTRPWSPSASVKPLSHSGCRENRTNKHSYHLSLEATRSGDIAPSNLDCSCLGYNNTTYHQSFSQQAS
ncbi:hypothetical protein HanXRQr2_Chr10g0427741 [Helianthus annuus]|uniref:Uncharacterized protein n=1 Tax=Helianthus annuus TaxID=4232 RepID=A0A9K3HVA9_HELAN|nr:hypothetical protein HanXRQr2_Chr10g0427741 [Helianthus annuus]